MAMDLTLREFLEDHLVPEHGARREFESLEAENERLRKFIEGEIHIEKVKSYAMGFKRWRSTPFIRRAKKALKGE